MPLATNSAVTMKKGMFFTNDGMLKPRTGFSAPRRARTLQNALSQNVEDGALANASRPATYHQASGRNEGRPRSSSPPRKSEAGPRPSVKAEYVPTWGRKSKAEGLGGEEPRAAARPSSTPAMSRRPSRPEFQPTFARGKSTVEGGAAGAAAASSTPAAAAPTRSASQAGLQSQTSRADYNPSWGRSGTSKFDSAEEKEAARRAEILGAAHTARPARGEYEPAWGRGRKTNTGEDATAPAGNASEGSSAKRGGNRGTVTDAGDSGARSGSTPATARQSRAIPDRGVRRSSIGSGSGMNRSASTSALDRKDGFEYGSNTSRAGGADTRKSAAALAAADVAANAANAVNADPAGGPLGWDSLNETANTGKKKLVGWSASKLGPGATSANIGDSTSGPAGPTFSYEGAGMPSWREEDGVIGRGRQRGGVAGGTLGGKMLNGNGRTLTGETAPNITEKNTELVEQEKWQKWRQLVEKNTLGGHYDRMPELLRADFAVEDPDQKEHDAALADSRMLHNRRPSDVLHPRADHPKPAAAIAFNDRALRLREGRGMRRALLKDDPPVTEWTAHHGSCSCPTCKPNDMKAAGVLSHESFYNKVPPCGKDYHILLPGQAPGELGISKTFKSEGIVKTLTHGGAADNIDEEKYFMRFLGRKVRGGQSPDSGSGMMMHRSMSENDIRYIAAGQYPLKHPELLTHGSKGHQPWQVSLGSARVRHGMDFVLDPQPEDPPPPSQVVASRKARGIFHETHSDEAARLARLRNQEVLRFADPSTVFKRPVFADSDSARVPAGVTSANFQKTRDVRCGNLACSPRRGLSNSSSAMALLLHHENVNKTFEQEKAWRLRSDPLFADLCVQTSKNTNTQKQLVESLKNTHGIHVVKAKDEMLWDTN